MITVTINGIDRSSTVVFNSIRKTDTLNQEVDTLELTTRKYGSITYVPTVGHEIVVTNGATTIFGGVIVRITESVKASKIIEYKVQCNDYSQYLRRKLVTERYENMTVLAIITDIKTNYASDFTVANVAVGPTIESISFNRLTVAECLQKLADAISYVWYVDYDQDIHFFAKNTELAPFDITDTSSNYIYNSLEIVEDLTQLKNSVLVQGGESTSASPRTETYTGNGTKVEYPLANKFAELPVVTVNSVAKTVGTEYLDDDGSFQCMWNFNEKYIRFTSGNTPANGHAITIAATYLVPIVVRVPAPASIASFGTYEFAITDKSIVSQQEAIDRALAELQVYQNQIYDGKFRTYVDGLRSGQVININSTQRGKNIDVLIQSVSVRMRDPIGTSFEYDVTFATLKSIGIIEYLQRQLRDREIVIDDQETLLNYFQIEDSMGLTDSLDTPSTNSPPYVYGPTGGSGNVGKWNFATWG
jgi:hypothetical protein